MFVLGIDTALKSCAAAILADGAVLAERGLPLEKGHAEHLAPMVAETLREAGLGVRALDRVGVVVGPGGFAGVRVGLAFARGLALGTGLSIVGVTSLEALAAGARAQTGALVAPVVDARRGQVYAGLYEAGGALRLPPFVAEPEEALLRLALAAGAGEVRLVGDGARLLGRLPAHFALLDGPDQIDARQVAQLAAAAPAPSGPPAPLYLRPPDARRGEPSLFEGLFEDPFEDGR